MGDTRTAANRLSGMRIRSVIPAHIAVALALAWAVPARAQSNAPAAAPLPDTGTSLTSDMLLLDRELLAQTIGPLERWGHSFYALSLYVADTLGPPRLYSYGLEHSPTINEPGPIADSLRSAMRLHFSGSRGPRTVAIVMDSIAGSFTEAVDGIEGPQFPRMAITEIEDRTGRCRRLERDYRFVNDPKSGTGWGFGHVRFDAPRITRCEPRRFWPSDSVVEVPTRPHVVKPMVRALSISSLDNYFSVVGRFNGQLTVYDDSIVVQFDTLIATRRLPEDTQTIRLDSIRVGVGVGDDKGWSPINNSKALLIGRRLSRGGTIERHDVRFLMEHERGERDANSWIVVTFHITVGRPGEPGYLRAATTYAHSKRGVLAAP
jgi:hypothetical protein